MLSSPNGLLPISTLGRMKIALSEIVAPVAVNVLTNDFNNAFSIEVDIRLVEPAQYAAAA